MAAINWHTYAGGTGAVPGKYSYAAYTDVGEYHIDPPPATHRRAGYQVLFANTKGILLASGLWHRLGIRRSPAAAKKLAREHHDAILRELAR